MSQGDSTSEVRFCTNCGAGVSPDNNFCSLCGVEIVSREQASEHVPLEDRLFPKQILNALKNLPEKLWGWFSGQQKIVKTAVFGVLLLAALALLSPVVLVLSALVFVGSLIGLSVSAVRRDPVQSWIVASLGSLLGVVLFAGVSSFTYGGLLGGGGGGGSTYEVVQQGEAPLNSDQGLGTFVIIASDSLDNDQLRTIAEDMIEQKSEYDTASITVYDRDEAVYGDGIESLDTGELYEGDLYYISIVNTPAGERVEGMLAQVGEYAIERVPGPGSATASYGDVQYYEYTPATDPDTEEAGGSSQDAEASGENGADQDNASLLLSMLDLGTMDVAEGLIEGVHVDGTTATVTASGGDDEYVAYVCDYTLGAAREYGMDNESNDYQGITEAHVRRPGAFWNAITCSY